MYYILVNLIPFQRIPVAEMVYEKDPAFVTKLAIQKARDSGYDAVVVYATTPKQVLYVFSS